MELGHELNEKLVAVFHESAQVQDFPHVGGDGGIERGWLHTILELALLKRGAASPRDPRTIPEMADSRLH
jgi:hypothetical protein